MKTRRDQGFTLVEVLAALLIFSVSIMALMRAGAENAKAIYILEQKALAGIVADNQLALARLQYRASNSSNPPSNQTGNSKQNGHEYKWALKGLATDVNGFHRLEVEVTAKNKDQVLVSRSGFASRSTTVNSTQTNIETTDTEGGQ